MEKLLIESLETAQKCILQFAVTIRKKQHYFFGLLGILVFQAWPILEESLSVSRIFITLVEFIAGYTHFNCLIAFGKSPTIFQRTLRISCLAVNVSDYVLDTALHPFVD